MKMKTVLYIRFDKCSLRNIILADNYQLFMEQLLLPESGFFRAFGVEGPAEAKERA
jgi:hypothetical protein